MNWLLSIAALVLPTWAWLSGRFSRRTAILFSLAGFAYLYFVNYLPAQRINAANAAKSSSTDASGDQ